MKAQRRIQGVTLVELMIAAAVTSVLTYTAVMLLSGQIGFARSAALQTEVADRARMVREMISHDIMQAGFHWTREGERLVGQELVKSGTFGPAGLGSGLANWPQYPVTGSTGLAGAPDLIHLIIPARGEIIGAGASPTSVDYACREGANMGLTANNMPNPPWATSVMVLSGAGSTLLGMTPSGPQTAIGGFIMSPMLAGQCYVGRVIDDAAAPPLPAPVNGWALSPRTVAYPVQGITWAVDVNKDDLYRCVSTTPGGGPHRFTAANVAGNADCALVMRGIEDLQFRYVFAERNSAGAGGELVDGCDDPGLVHSVASTTWALTSILPIDCLGARLKRKVATNQPAIRFVGVQVGVVARALRPDRRHFRDRGKFIPAPGFDRADVGAPDNLRRETQVWRVAVPNGYAYGAK